MYNGSVHTHLHPASMEIEQKSQGRGEQAVSSSWEAWDAPSNQAVRGRKGSHSKMLSSFILS